MSIDLALVETETPLDPRFTPPPLADGDGPPVGDDAILAGYGVAREGAPRAAGPCAARGSRCARRCRASCCGPTMRRAAPAHAAAISGAPLFLADGETVAAIVAWTSGGERGKRCGGLTQGPLIAPQRDWIAATLARWAR